MAALAAKHSLLRAARMGDKKLFLESILLHTDPDDERNCLRQLTASGNSALHVAASCGHTALAELIYRRDAALIAETNEQLETPLHCAAKAGSAGSAAVILSAARESGMLDGAVRCRNRRGETALHEAVRLGHEEVARVLLTEDEELAGLLDDKGVSPMYMAAASGSFSMVKLLCSTFTGKENAKLSSAGPDGQTALHAAVLHSCEMSKVLLQWNPTLTKEVDGSLSTPLHYAASAGNGDTVKLLLEYDISAAYLKDSDGFFPIHIAARLGHSHIIQEVSQHCLDCDEMLDNGGRNFLHIAIEHKKWAILKQFQGSLLLERMANVMDSEGNTPLHIAVKSGDQISVTLLMSNCCVQTNLTNERGLTALDLAVLGTDRGVAYTLNPQVIILHCLAWTGALLSPRRLDQFIDSFNIGIYNDRELKKYSNITQNLVIGSVLIATVAFTAIFTLPGGYVSDAHPNPGTPILFEMYSFKAFVTSNTLAFVGSILSTIWLTYAGSDHVHPQIRGGYMMLSMISMEQATRSLIIAFALGAYVVLGQVSQRIAIVICAATMMALLLRNLSMWQLAFLVAPIRRRLGLMGMLKTHMTAETKNRLTIAIGPNIAHMVLRRFLSMLSTYAFIFLLALL